MSDLKVSYMSVSIFIAIGTLVVLSLVIFGKRQIMRFTIKSARRPHLPTGHSASPELQDNIQLLLTQISKIHHHPQLMHNNCEVVPQNVNSRGLTLNYKYRMLALDGMAALDKKLASFNEPSYNHQMSSKSPRAFLLDMHQSGPLMFAPIDLVRNFIDSYEHARYSTDKFEQDDYSLFIERLQLILSCLEDYNKYADSDARNDSDALKLETHVKMSTAGYRSVEITTLPVTNRREQRASPKLSRKAFGRLSPTEQSHTTTDVVRPKSVLKKLNR